MGGRLRSPFYVIDVDPPYRPEMVLWVELPGEVPVAVSILDPEAESPSLMGSLLDSFANPMAGPPRRPRRIRLADEVDAAEVRAAVGPGIEVVVAPTPELGALAKAMAEGAGGEVEESYFEEGRISADLVADLFAAGRVLHAVAPWKHAGDVQTLRMDIPALDVEGACVSIIGALGQSRGLLVFPSHSSFEAFLEASETEPPGEGLADLDLGTAMLSLTLDRPDELPPSMRREALEHGWQVAGPDAYPRVEHRDRDGVARPLTERDVRVAAACALAVAAFTTSHGDIFSADGFEPVSVTYTGDDEVDVRLTAPYQAADLFEPDVPPAPIAREEDGRRRVSAVPAPPKARPSRNAPCWCGSGTKYKRCHLEADRAAEAQHTQPAPVHTVDERLVHRMAHFAMARFGPDWLDRAEGHFADAEAAAQLFLPWAVYHLPAEGQPVVDWFLAEHSRRLSREERSWLDAQRAAWLSVWEVLEVAPGTGLGVRDLLTGAERRVAEVSGSRTLVARDALLARVVDHGGVSVFAGVHPRPLAPLDAAEVVRAVRRRVRRRREVPVERLREHRVERALIACWEEGVAESDARHRVPPTLHNTDGDELLFTTDHFAFDPAVRAKVEAALDRIEDLEGPDAVDGGRLYVFIRTEGAEAAMPGGTVLGRVRVAGAGVTLETNSLARADRLRERLEAACGELLVHRVREHTSPSVPSDSAAQDVEDQFGQPPSSPDVERALAEWVEHYHAAWVKQPVPALGHMTPLEAAGTRDGRERLDVLLKDMENRAARWPHGRTPDVPRLRAELGMED